MFPSNDDKSCASMNVFSSASAKLSFHSSYTEALPLDAAGGLPSPRPPEFAVSPWKFHGSPLMMMMMTMAIVMMMILHTKS